MQTWSSQEGWEWLEAPCLWPTLSHCLFVLLTLGWEFSVSAFIHWLYPAHSSYLVPKSPGPASHLVAYLWMISFSIRVSLPAHSSCLTIFAFSLRALLVALDHLPYAQTQHRHIKANTSKPDPTSPPVDLLLPRLGGSISSTPWKSSWGQVPCITPAAVPPLRLSSSAHRAIRIDYWGPPTSDTLRFCCTRLPVLTSHHHRTLFPKVILIMFSLCLTRCKDRR